MTQRMGASARISRTALAAASIFLGSSLLTSPPASATTQTAQDPPRSSRSVRFLPGPSEETPAARARRLKRECKGRPNAGACLGHTR
jgi:hypothetical protein